ncbi:unnamed protein product [Polarella glacialis]|uniref:PDZ domain-containing protein n=1 Tax=Polarella glacialis TaxID=89957 RepID=A0A813ETC4_POLGL|nr:unnamed protein product [Polarella glacialis]
MAAASNSDVTRAVHTKNSDDGNNTHNDNDHNNNNNNHNDNNHDNDKHSDNVVAAAGQDSVARLRGGVVKIFCRSVAANFLSPWQKKAQGGSTGSGLCINRAARHVLTNAHVVKNAVAVRVRRYGDSVRYTARVLCVSPQCDLALLEVADEAFWRGVTAIQLSEGMPALDSDVLALGYPMGGDNLSVTRGVVSRLDLMDYTFSPVGGERQPVIQIDAAINPGNSGGPVLDPSGCAIGVAFAGLSSGENIGFVIPGSVALFFLRGYAKCGSFRGLCSLGLRVQQTQSMALRDFQGLAAGHSDSGGNAPASRDGGVLVVDVAPLSSAAAAGLQVGDVLLSVDGVPISEDGTVTYQGRGFGERIGFDYLVSAKVEGEVLALEVLRKVQAQGTEDEIQDRAAETTKLEVRAAPLEKLVPRTAGVDAVPSYFIVGGLVFLRLTLPWLEARFGRGAQDAPADLQQKLREHKASHDEEVVVLAKVLAADVNYGYEDFSCLELLELGVHEEHASGSPLHVVHRIRSLRQLRCLVQEVLLSLPDSVRPGSPGPLLRFQLSCGYQVVLDASACKAAQSEILEQHAIRQDCSDDLLDLGRGSATA